MIEVTNIDLKELQKSMGTYTFCAVMCDLIEEGKVAFSNSKNIDKKAKPVLVTLRGLWEALVGPVGSTLEYAIQREGHISLLHQLKEDASPLSMKSFPVIAGELLSKEIIKSYESLEMMIGDELVDEFESSLMVDKVPGMSNIGYPEKLLNAQEYPFRGLEEKWVQIEGDKYGEAVAISEEDIFFDRTGIILKRCNAIGSGARMFREKMIIEGIADINGTVYRPSGTATALYSANFGNLKTSNPLTDETSLTAARLLLDAMKDDSGDNIPILAWPKQVLVPTNLIDTLLKILGSEYEPGSGNNAINVWGPKGRYKPQALTSPYLSSLSTTTWYIGDFKKQFAWKRVWPFQTIQDDLSGFTRDIKLCIKTRFYGEIGALDYKYVIKNTA